jgi:hypothetical protein
MPRYVSAIGVEVVGTGAIGYLHNSSCHWYGVAPNTSSMCSTSISSMRRRYERLRRVCAVSDVIIFMRGSGKKAIATMVDYRIASLRGCC